MSPTLDPHQRYEELCALAGAGQLHGAEAAELNQHLAVCSECRESVRDFAYLCVQVLPAYLADESLPLPAGMAERFIERARSEGIQIGERTEREIFTKTVEPVRRNPWKAAFWVSVAASLLIFGIVTWVVRRGQESLSAGVVRDRDQTRSTPVIAPTSAAGSNADTTPSRVPDSQALRDQLSSTEAQLAIASEESKQHQRDLENTKHEKAELISKIAALEESNKAALNEARDIQAQRDAEILQLKKDLERVRSEETGDRTASLVSESELRNLRSTVDQQKLQLDELRRLNAAEHSANDIMVSRTLHLLDILPRDENGNPTREFGRLFYAEGKKLEFYAFDLDDPKRPNAKTAFYVWGEAKGTDKRNNPSQVVSLGKFSFESAKENRWGLVVTDPRLLARLRSVFVTVETSEHPVNEPTGKRMLSASLDRKANHP